MTEPNIGRETEKRLVPIFYDKKAHIFFSACEKFFFKES